MGYIPCHFPLIFGCGGVQVIVSGQTSNKIYCMQVVSDSPTLVYPRFSSYSSAFNTIGTTAVRVCEWVESNRVTHSPSLNLSGNSNPRRPSSASARQAPCHPVSLSLSLRAQQSHYHTLTLSHPHTMTSTHPHTLLPSHTHLNMSSNDSTTSSASSRGNLPVIRPIL